MSEESTQHREQDSKLAELHVRLVSSVEKLITGEEWKRAIEFAARFRSRSFGNTLLIWWQHDVAYRGGTVPEPLPTYVAGFKQWQTLGRRIAAGQKGYMIFAPLTARFATPAPNDPMSWRRLQRGERPRPGEVVRPRMAGVRPAYVWDVSQTDGRPLPEMPSPQLLRGEAPDGLWNALSTLVESEGFSVSSVDDRAALAGANGMTDSRGRRVIVRADMDTAARTKTLAHELAHIRMHNPETDAVRHRGIGEVEAESVALMIGAAHGMNTEEYTIPYVSSWATSVDGKAAVEVVQETGERVRRTASAILDQLPTAQGSAGDPPGLDRSPAASRVGIVGTKAPPSRPRLLGARSL